MSEPFIVGRESRLYYASDCIEHIEEHNCAKGCRLGLANPEAFADYGPGGSCDILARVMLEEPIPEIIDDGLILHCTARQPLDLEEEQ
jgi:hypothetical protein